MSNRPHAQLARFLEQLAAAARWPSHRVITTPPDVPFTQVLLDVFRALAPPDEDAAQLPGRPAPLLVGAGDDRLGYASVAEAYFTPRGDGLLTTAAPRGFMPGMGQTLRYYLLVQEGIVMESEDYWEDNIADPDAADFQIRATGAAALERAVQALTRCLAARGVTALKGAGDAREETDVRGG